MLSHPLTPASFPDLEIRLKEQTVSCNGQLVTLTHHEFAVLAYLARHPDWVFSASRSTRPYGIGTANTAVLPLPASSVDPAQADAGHTKAGYIRTVLGSGYKFNSSPFKSVRKARGRVIWSLLIDLNLKQLIAFNKIMLNSWYDPHPAHHL